MEFRLDKNNDIVFQLFVPMKPVGNLTTLSQGAANLGIAETLLDIIKLNQRFMKVEDPLTTYHYN